MTKINEQLIFNLNRQGKIGLENFFISESNNLAVNTIKNWQHWPTKKIPFDRKIQKEKHRFRTPLQKGATDKHEIPATVQLRIEQPL